MRLGDTALARRRWRIWEEGLRRIAFHHYAQPRTPTSSWPPCAFLRSLLREGRRAAGSDSSTFLYEDSDAGERLGEPFETQDHHRLVDDRGRLRRNGPSALRGWGNFEPDRTHRCDPLFEIVGDLLYLYFGNGGPSRLALPGSTPTRCLTSVPRVEACRATSCGWRYGVRAPRHSAMTPGWGPGWALPSWPVEVAHRPDSQGCAPSRWMGTGRPPLGLTHSTVSKAIAITYEATTSRSGTHRGPKDRASAVAPADRR